MGKWETVRWEQVLQIKNGKNQKAVVSSSGMYPIYGSGGIMGYANDYICPEKTTIIGRKGSINNPIYVEQKFWNVDTAFGLVANPNLDSKFLYFFCFQYDFQRHNRAVTIPSLTKSDLLQIYMPLPPLDEQKRIVKNLDLASEIVKGYKEQLAELDKLVQSVFYEMFGDPVTNEKGWKIQKLKDITSLIQSGNTPKGGKQVYIDSGIMFIRSQNVWKNRIELNDVAYIDEVTHKKMSKTSLKHNDILITKTGRFNTENSSLGRAALYSGDDNIANINGHVYLVRLNAGIEHKFVLHILTADEYREYIRSVCVGGIDKRQINKEHLEEFPIILPPLSLQTHFASIVTEIEAQKAKIQQALTEAENLFNSLMQEYFE